MATPVETKRRPKPQSSDVLRNVAAVTRHAATESSYTCDSCGGAFAGRPASAGLYVWTRGDEVRYEEPPLCEACGPKLALGALLSWAADFEE